MARAVRIFTRFASSFHLPSWEMVRWLVNWRSAEVDMPFACLINKHVSCYLKFPVSLGIQQCSRSADEYLARLG